MKNHLIQILIPLADNAGRPFAKEFLEDVKRQLVDKFGGMTAFERSPARGVWAPENGARQQDDVVTVEVMVEDIDESWWSTFKTRLESELDQDELVIRVFRVRTL